MRLKGTTIVGLIIMLASVIMGVFLFSFSFRNKNADAPVLVLYGANEGRFPDTSFRVALKSAGIDHVVLSKNLKKSEEIGEEMSLPQGYRSKNVIILAQGKEATGALKLFDDDEDTLGFVLINPEFETNYSMEGMSSKNPVHDVAIFAGDQSKVNDAKLMYERLSGEDTVYGVKFKTGGIFSSETCTNPSGNRVLSISGFDYGDGNLIYFSPVFQIELATYLSATYGTGDEVSWRITCWYALFVFFAIFFVAGLFLFLSKFPVMRYKMNSEHKGKLASTGFVLAAIMSGLATVACVVFTIIDKLQDKLKYLVVFLPIVFVFFMAIVRIGYVFSNRNIKRKSNRHIFVSIALGVLISLDVVFVLLNFFGNLPNTDIENYRLYCILAAVLDFACILVLATADNISRTKGLGGCSYFGKKHMLVFTLIPSIAAFLLMSGLGKDYAAFDCFMGILATAVPFVAALPVKLHTNSVVMTALTHSLTVMFVLLLTV